VRVTQQAYAELLDETFARRNARGGWAGGIGPHWSMVAVEDGLDVVSVGVVDVRRVVAGVVLGAQPWLPIVGAPGREAGSVKCLHCGFVLGVQADVYGSTGRVVLKPVAPALVTRSASCSSGCAGG
jgi:hypothetical protein